MGCCQSKYIDLQEIEELKGFTIGPYQNHFPTTGDILLIKLKHKIQPAVSQGYASKDHAFPIIYCTQFHKDGPAKEPLYLLILDEDNEFGSLPVFAKPSKESGGELSSAPRVKLVRVDDYFQEVYRRYPSCEFWLAKIQPQRPNTSFQRVRTEKPSQEEETRLLERLQELMRANIDSEQVLLAQTLLKLGFLDETLWKQHPQKKKMTINAILANQFCNEKFWKYGEAFQLANP